FQCHVSGALDGPLIILFEQDGTDQPDHSSSHNVASFQWKALVQRDSLRSQYGEGFRIGLLTEAPRGAPGQAREGAHGPAQGDGTGSADRVRGEPSSA